MPSPLSADRSIQEVEQKLVRESDRVALHAAGPLRGRDDLGAFARTEMLRGEGRYLQLRASSLDPRQAIPDIGRWVSREKSRDLGVALERGVPPMLGMQDVNVNLHHQRQEPGADRAMVMTCVGAEHGG